MPSQWDAKADRDLLLAIIDEGALKSVLWPKIAQKMKDRGYTFSHEACRQHFQKIRKEAKSPSKSATSTPRKRSTNDTPTSSFKSSSQKTNTTTSSILDDEDFETPTKKRKKNEHPIKEEVDFQQAYRFKAENEGEIIDIEREE
ncbi:uncharacterized protein LY89DRAFT_741353 [Mollisia scopiformis]|uniref:Myb-like domain-containing protein n=1 Tax=Mollisia scopiformis TaxID=149040 RepID=A0A132B9I2_MOLSC|nr:uncharacterized protein LY89DRAFT_741353 [Mollisia scopiformis]KUJ09055.1 hypothetical protein LY89DRAFT_741353 [Mollisia scopiformis]